MGVAVWEVAPLERGPYIPCLSKVLIDICFHKTQVNSELNKYLLAVLLQTASQEAGNTILKL